MSKYQKGKIYKLVNDTLNLTYYGSTCQKYLHGRFYEHKKKKDLKKFSSYKLFETGQVKIFLVESYPCNSRLELEKRERFYIENNECVNINKPARKAKEYREVNKDILDKKQSVYYQNNKEAIKLKQRLRDKKKSKCSICNKEMLLSSINRHIKRNHSILILD
tara:strand:+ start:54 stop:542 length:489 start_codon:yes stop_codon:yes gene_type:complete